MQCGHEDMKTDKLDVVGSLQITVNYLSFRKYIQFTCDLHVKPYLTRTSPEKFVVSLTGTSLI